MVSAFRLPLHMSDLDPHGPSVLRVAEAGIVLLVVLALVLIATWAALRWDERDLQLPPPIQDRRPY